MSRTIQYVDRQGNVYDEIPEGKVQPYIVKGQAVTEGAHDRYYNEHPTELDEVVITPETQKESQTTSYDPTMTEQNMFHRSKVAAADARVRKTAFTDENTLPFWLHAISPSQQIGAIIDGFQGGSYGDYVRSLTYGNSGVFPDNYAAGNPVISTVGNIGFDILAPYSWMKFYRYATTPKIIEGATETQRVISYPFSPYVHKVINGDAEYVALKNSLSKRVLKSKYEGNSLEGYPVYRQLKVIPSKTITKEFRRGLAKDNFYPTTIEGYDNVVAFNPMRKLFLDDIEGNVGRLPWLPFRQYAYDLSALTPAEQVATIGYRKGGKLISKYKSCNI